MRSPKRSSKRNRALGKVAASAERMARDAEERGNMREAAEFWTVALFLRDLAGDLKPVLGQMQLGE